MQRYDAVVIGGGPGGYVCAIRLAQLKQKVLCIEKEEVGGVCLNWGCIPSKALISASHLYDTMRHGAAQGLVAEGVKLDVPAMQAWKNGIVRRLTGGIRGLFRNNGVELCIGAARVLSAHQVEIVSASGEKQVVEASKGVVIATGATTRDLPGFSFDGEKILGAKEAVHLPYIPKRLLVIGGGVIGLELGGVYQRLGADVTLVEVSNTLLPGIDPDCTSVVEKRFVQRGAKVYKHTKALGYSKNTDGSLAVTLKQEGQEESAVVVDTVLIAVGMRPNSTHLGLEEAGVHIEQGFVVTNMQGRTNVPWIYAIGDVSGAPFLAHKASKEGEVVAEVIAGHNVAKDWVAIPSAVFTDPEIGAAGLTEAQAKEQGIPTKTGKFPVGALGRAMSACMTDGVYKIVMHAETHEVLGVHLCGPSATDLISEGMLALEMHARAEDIHLTMHPHPTFSEGIMEAAAHAMGHAIHIMNKL